MDSNSAEQWHTLHPVVAYSGDAGLKGPKTDVHSTGQVQNRPPANPFLDIAQTKQLPVDFSQTSIAGNGNTVNYNTTYVIKNDNSSKKRHKKRKKDKTEKSHRSKQGQESERGRKRPSSEGPSEELEAKKKKKKKPSSAPDKPRVTPLAPSNKHNQNGRISNASPETRRSMTAQEAARWQVK